MNLPSPGIPAFILLACLLPTSPLRSQEEAIDPAKLPPPAASTADFITDIQPILEQSCLRCHGPEKPKSRFRLDNRASALEGGATGIAILPGDSARSPLIHYVARLVEEMEMPPIDKGDPLTDGQIGLLRAWIDAGAEWPSESAGPKQELSLTPYFGWLTVSGNEQTFREHHWQRSGAGGGLEHFRLHEQIDPDRSVTVDGHAFPLESDYRVRLSMDRRGVGFTRLGFQQLRRYYDDSGGYHEPFPEPQFDLGRNLHIDVGKLWIETGLTLPELPRVVLGYEYHYRDGQKSLLGWGPSTQLAGPATVTRLIRPSYKGVDEDLHVVRLDVSHTLAGIDLEDNFRFEDYSLETAGNTATTFPDPASTIRVNEKERHDRVANAFHLSKAIREWWFASAGHFYSHTDASAALASSTLDAALQPTSGIYWSTDGILLNRDSHYFNLNSRFGPWQHFTLSLGARLELTAQESLGNTTETFIADPSLPPVLPPPAALDSSLDQQGLEESAILRYTRIPHTVLYAETRHQQKSIDQREEQTGGTRPLLRDTDTAVQRAHYRAGANYSPIQWLSLHGSYTHRLNQNRYDHNIDEPAPPAAFTANGYSAFITSHDFTSDEVEVKLVTKPANWIRATLSWRTAATDYETGTDGITIIGPGLVIVPGGSLLSGNYDANTYSAGLILTPLTRLYCSTTFSYTESRTTTRANGSPAIVSYQGDVYTAVVSANYVLNEKTDFFGSFAFSLADYGQDHAAAGLALGADYQQHAVQAGLRRRITSRLSTGLRYSFFRFDESNRGGLTDYTAHGIFATLALTLP